MSELQPGSSIHRYEIIKVLGSGAFGVVYLVRHKSLDYQVVIKEYLPRTLAHRVQGKVVPLQANVETIFEQSLLRFKQECETLLTLNHPNIVYVYDCFYDGGTAYMVMHKESGNTLWESYAEQVQQQQRALAWRQLQPIMPGVLSGLQYMHERELIHRDIKPGNIFLRAGQRIHPLLIDFGAVKVGKGFSSAYAQNTPVYAALEQDYDIHPIGPWTDVHAIGVMLTELLTGQRPLSAYERQQQVAAGVTDPIVTIIDEIAAREGAQLAQALLHATQLHPQQRLQTIEQLQRALTH
ncbi:serine/threonine protein kinase [Pseudidiomarina mangrovi]|uniref:serine/threonine protein kinase n=1 Tax=Pseudidiomarina mangrovi TaxID=2487133 RepID=UPI000FCC5CAA|nr:serine/threonine-protein kinase [Pseudidiomarina mangrovi]